jgi:hypothetical protein
MAPLPMRMGRTRVLTCSTDIEKFLVERLHQGYALPIASAISKAEECSVGSSKL